ncbi:hypothetical protein GCM10010112_51640 [Actinoplanes lobatus]|uniref:Uncharacterized protein n=1 Tax=Actinoplanes lobatus TaxID=113568 RepID=A0ABQ4ABE3_9ACTN|nr:hypothetical protein GCM10010112_51640 [Actinoplanes lobatus]GIE38308.1 hypothetical protein Alo02nite_12060 [Actinoplanes lobatus]
MPGKHHRNPPTRSERQHTRGIPTDLSPAGAAQAGVGSKIAPTGRNGPERRDSDTRTRKEPEAKRGLRPPKVLQPGVTRGPVVTGLVPV